VEFAGAVLVTPSRLGLQGSWGAGTCEGRRFQVPSLHRRTAWAATLTSSSGGAPLGPSGTGGVRAASDQAQARGQSSPGQLAGLGGGVLGSAAVRRPNKALELTGRRPGAYGALQPPARRWGV
jgi:hypothetical protein